MSATADETKDFQLFWTGDSEIDCVEICRDLMSAGVEYRVSQQPIGLSGRMGVDSKFRIGILRSQFQLAKEAAGWAMEKAPDDQELELKEDSAVANKTEQDHGRIAAEYLRRWSPDDATIEICSRPSSDKSSTTELSLTENLIHFRVDKEKTGTRKYFVLPEDEARAREIVRQIQEGEPPQ